MAEATPATHVLRFDACEDEAQHVAIAFRSIDADTVAVVRVHPDYQECYPVEQMTRDAAKTEWRRLVAMRMTIHGDRPIDPVYVLTTDPKLVGWALAAFADDVCDEPPHGWRMPPHGHA